MHIPSSTDIELVKTFTQGDLQLLDLRNLRGFMDAKGFDIKIVKALAERGEFAQLFSNLVLRRGVNIPIDQPLLNTYAASIDAFEQSPAARYTGSHLQNNRIDRAVASSGTSNGNVKFGEGAATSFAATVPAPTEAQSVPIAIIGYGAAGIFAAFALQSMGFRKVTVFEKSRPLGVWSIENVFKLSRNNPQRLEFFGRALDAAPGNGQEVHNFLKDFATLRAKEETVVAVEPGKLDHAIVLNNGERHRFPIVINAIGLGKPKPVSDPRRMTTQTGALHAGLRWQVRLEQEKVAGQRIVLIGLGNSTAEMLRQIHALADTGYAVDYRILTHYPAEAVENPTEYVPSRDRMFRVFRDTSKPNLVDYQGDLPQSRYDYFRALHGGKIISDVTRWEVPQKGSMEVYGKNKKVKEVLPYDKIMTLIGYAQSQETMAALGCTYDDENHCGIFDYDGECVKTPGSVDPARRIHKGYFCFGSVLEGPLNPNALVIPGMLHRIGDLLFGVVMRSMEVRKKQVA